VAGARALLERSLAILEQVHERKGHPSVAAALHTLAGSLYTLAGVLAVRGDLASARALLERVLAILEQVYGREGHPDVAATYNGLGQCLRNLGLLDDSERAFRAALRIRERVLGNRDHYMYAETEFELALLLFQRERPDESTELVRHAVTVLQAQVPDHPILDRFRSGVRADEASE
jgi:tetratricopeptide (TPR) repeat protein